MFKPVTFLQASYLAPKAISIITLVVGCGYASSNYAAQPWPGENWEDAVALGSLNSSFSNGDISGAHWNDNTRTLWLCDNSEEVIWSLSESGETFIIDQSFSGTGDLEGITQGLADNRVYLIDEDNVIRAYDTNSGEAQLTWNIGQFLPGRGSDNRDGPEGITFIPDNWLAKSDFRNQSGAQFNQSQFDLGGIFLVAHQSGGSVYAFDISNSGDVVFIGEYETSAKESSGLEFDRSTGRLYISHNVDGNTLEVTKLSSTATNGHRRFVTTGHFDAPNGSNLEGFALTPARSNNGSVNEVWAFWVDDNGNTSDGNAILWFKNIR